MGVKWLITIINKNIKHIHPHFESAKNFENETKKW